jgi:cell division protein FtsB
MFGYMYTNEMDKDEIIKQLQDELHATKQELTATKEHLKKYTAPERNRNRYNPVKAREYQSTVSPEKKKRVRKTSLFETKRKTNK